MIATAVAGGGALRKTILALWQRTRLDWGFVTDRLSATFRQERRLGSHERRFIAETLYGMVRHVRRVDEALAAGGARGPQPSDDDRLLAYLVLEGGLAVAEARRVRPGLDWSAVAGIDAQLAKVRDPVRRLALGCSLPDWIAALLVAEYGDEAEALARGLNDRAPMTVRANLLVGDADALAARLAREHIATTRGTYAPAALHLETRTNIFGLEAFRAGALEAQDEGSQLLAELVAPPPRSRVVDYCAGAGGKTLALAAAMGNRGRIVAADVDERKLVELRRRAHRAGATTVQAVGLGSGDAPPPLAALVGKAERVLVDAPCTGLGALRRNPEARWRLQPADLARLPGEQRAISERALAFVAPGGRLIYATCSIVGAENSGVVGALLAAHPDLELVLPKEIWGAERAAPLVNPVARGVLPAGAALELLPHRHGTDGFFAAVLRRRASST